MHPLLFALLNARSTPFLAAHDGFKYRIMINPVKELALLLDFRPMEERDRDVELAFHLVTAGGTKLQPVRKVRTCTVSSM